MEETRFVGIVLALVGILAFLALLSWVVAMLSGWQRLAATYANDTPFEANRWRFAQATIRRWVLGHSNLTLRVGADRQYLYLRTWPFNFPGFRELQVPWSDVSMQHQKILFWKICRLSFSQHPEILIQLSDTVMQSALASVGGVWADGRAQFHT